MPRPSGKHMSRNGQVPEKKARRDAREAEGAPLLREYRVKSLIEGSNPSLSARHKNAPARGFFCAWSYVPMAIGLDLRPRAIRTRPGCGLPKSRVEFRLPYVRLSIVPGV